MGIMTTQPLPTKSKKVDPVDIAYLALGANLAWAEANNEQRDSTDGGQLGYIEEVINAAAQALADLWNAEADNSEGVFYYEVSEPTGLAIGKAILEGVPYDAEVIARTCMEAAAACGHSVCRQSWIDNGSTECAGQA